MTTKTRTQSHAQKMDAIQTLKNMGIEAGVTVYTTLKYCSPNGMRRRISCFIVRPAPTYINDDYPRDTAPRIQCIDYLVAQATGCKHDPRGGIVMGGCGMDMGFALVYSLGRALYPDRFTLAPHQYGRNGDTSGFDIDGGYALKHEWI